MREAARVYFPYSLYRLDRVDVPESGLFHVFLRNELLVYVRAVYREPSPAFERFEAFFHELFRVLHVHGYQVKAFSGEFVGWLVDYLCVLESAPLYVLLYDLGMFLLDLVYRDGSASEESGDEQ